MRKKNSYVNSSWVQKNRSFFYIQSKIFISKDFFKRFFASIIELITNFKNFLSVLVFSLLYNFYGRHLCRHVPPSGKSSTIIRVISCKDKFIIFRNQNKFAFELKKNFLNLHSRQEKKSREKKVRFFMNFDFFSNYQKN